jgi:hypothetical protein
MNSMLNLDLKAKTGYRIVSNDRNACPIHFGCFNSKADADAALAIVHYELADAGNSITYKVTCLR